MRTHCSMHFVACTFAAAAMAQEPRVLPGIAAAPWVVGGASSVSETYVIVAWTVIGLVFLFGVIEWITNFVLTANVLRIVRQARRGWLNWMERRRHQRSLRTAADRLESEIHDYYRRADRDDGEET